MIVAISNLHDLNKDSLHRSLMITGGITTQVYVLLFYRLTKIPFLIGS